MIKNVKQFLFIAGLLLIAGGAQPTMAAFWQWSTTPASNASADPNINWAEGMSPSSVNDSARAMMASLAVRGKDQGLLQATGTTAAIVLTTNTGYPNIAALNGQMLTFQHTLVGGNDPGATINIDGVGALPLYQGTAPIPGGLLEDRGVYSVICYSSNSRCYLVDNHANPYNTPLGGILLSTLQTPPNANFLPPFGQCISTTTYNAYWVALGSPASGGCPGGQFAILDMRGRAIVALDTLPGSTAAGRLTNAAGGCGTAMTVPGAACTGTEAVTLSTINLPPYTPSGSVSVQSALSDWVRGSLAGFSAASGASVFQAGNGLSSLASQQITSNGALAGNSQGGTSTPFARVGPSIGLVPYLRVL